MKTSSNSAATNVKSNTSYKINNKETEYKWKSRSDFHDHDFTIKCTIMLILFPDIYV